MILYEGSVYDPGTVTTLSARVLHNGTYSTNFFNASTRYPLLANELTLMDQQNTSVLARTDSVICSFQRAKYTVNHRYINSVHSRTIIAEPIDKLVNLIPDTHDDVLIVPGIGTSTGKILFGTGPSNWSAANLAICRDFQHCQLIEAMLYYIEGDFTGYAASTANTSNSTTAPGFLEGLGWSNSVMGQSYVAGRCPPLQASKQAIKDFSDKASSKSRRGQRGDHRESPLQHRLRQSRPRSQFRETTIRSQPRHSK